MQVTDLTQHDPEIGSILDVLRTASQANKPHEIHQAFSGQMRELAQVDGYMGVSVRGLEPGRYKVTRLLYADKEVGDPLNPWANWKYMQEHEGGVIGEIVSTPSPKRLSDISVADDPAFPEVMRNVRNALAIPLLDRGKVQNWAILLSENLDWQLTDERIRDIITRSNLIGSIVKMLVVNDQVHTLNQRLADQLEEVAQLQRSLLPDRVPKMPGIEIATSYLTSNTAGGDYYDFFEMGKNKLGVLIADVSGHGAGAATIVAMLRTILHGYQDRHKGPGAMLTHANRELMRNNLGSNFITAFMAELDTEQNRVLISNAGHHAPVVVAADGTTFTPDDARYIPLGVLDDAEYEQAEKPALPGSSVVMYTDGITEAFTPPPSREMFGIQGLISAVRSSDGSPDKMIESIHQGLFKHTHSRDRDDDQTIVALRHSAN